MALACGSGSVGGRWPDRHAQEGMAIALAGRQLLPVPGLVHGYRGKVIGPVARGGVVEEDRQAGVNGPEDQARVVPSKGRVGFPHPQVDLDDAAQVVFILEGDGDGQAEGGIGAACLGLRGSDIEEGVAVALTAGRLLPVSGAVYRHGGKVVEALPTFRSVVEHADAALGREAGIVPALLPAGGPEVHHRDSRPLVLGDVGDGDGRRVDQRCRAGRRGRREGVQGGRARSEIGRGIVQIGGCIAHVHGQFLPVSGAVHGYCGEEVEAAAVGGPVVKDLARVIRERPVHQPRVLPAVGGGVGHPQVDLADAGQVIGEGEVDRDDRSL